MLGQVLHDRYKVVGRLSHQDDLDVFLARELSEFVPLTLYVPSVRFAQTKLWRLLCRDALNQQRLRLTGIVRVIAAWEQIEPACIVLEHVEGLELPLLVGVLAPPEMVEVLQQVAELLSQLHAASQPHGSLRLSQIIVSVEGQVRLLAWSSDFREFPEPAQSNADRQSADLTTLARLIEVTLFALEDLESIANVIDSSTVASVLRELSAGLAETARRRMTAVDLSRRLEDLSQSHWPATERTQFCELLAQQVADYLAKKTTDKFVGLPARGSVQGPSAIPEVCVVEGADGAFQMIDLVSSREPLSVVRSDSAAARDRKATPAAAAIGADSHPTFRTPSVLSNAPVITAPAAREIPTAQRPSVVAEQRPDFEEPVTAPSQDDFRPEVTVTQSNMATSTLPEMRPPAVVPAPPMSPSSAAEQVNWQALRERAAARSGKRQSSWQWPTWLSGDWSNVGLHSTGDKVKAASATLAIVVCGWLLLSSNRDVPTDHLNRQAIYGTISGAEGRSGEITLIPKSRQPGLATGPAAGTAINSGKYAFGRADGPIPGDYEAHILLKSTTNQSTAKPSGQGSTDAWTSAVPEGFDPEITIDLSVPSSPQEVSIRIPN